MFDNCIYCIGTDKVSAYFIRSTFFIKYYVFYIENPIRLQLNYLLLNLITFLINVVVQ